MNGPLRLACVLAHPDDETLNAGGILARYAAEGVETYVITATRGEGAWPGDAEAYPGQRALARLREQELREAARVLGLQDVVLLNYAHGELDQASPAGAIGQIVGHLRRMRPQVVVTFDPYGSYGHPDHVAICQFTTAAVVAAANPAYASSNGWPSHQVSKLYYMANTPPLVDLYRAAVGAGNDERQAVAWPAWSVTTRVDTSAHWQAVWQALACHRSQLQAYEALRDAPEGQRRLWSAPTFYRVFSLVNGGRKLETDLFDGLR
ncbi:MAG TPA: PIG-L family deacetylase [Candidatus Sulfomarinibacteraceae bacterium]|nr:PIG-L family deacetylase [Candidatus Sulfomarinibacteraceae bacterium]